MVRFITAFAASLVLAASLATVASAQSPPPGNAGADQYTEGVPGAGGGSGGGKKNGGSEPGTGSGSGGSDGGAGLSPAAADALAAEGPDGAAAAAALSTPVPGGASSGKTPGSKANGAGRGLSGAGAAGEQGTRAGLTVESKGFSATIADLAGSIVGSDDGGMGVALPILLVLVLIGALALVVIRGGRGQRPSGS